MKKLLLMLFLPAISFAGTITTSFNPLGTITYSSATAAAASAPIAFDSSTFSGFISGGSPLTWNITIGSGSNRFIAIGCGTRISDTVTGVTVGGVSASLSTNTYSGTAENTYIYTLANPGSGVKAVAATTSSGISDRVKCGAVAWSNVLQSGTVDISTGARNNGGGVQASTATTSTANDVIMDVVSDGNNEAITVNSAQGQQWQEATGWTVAGSTRTTTTAGSYGMGWNAVNTPSAQSWIAIKPIP